MGQPSRQWPLAPYAPHNPQQVHNPDTRQLRQSGPSASAPALRKPVCAQICSAATIVSNDEMVVRAVVAGCAALVPTVDAWLKAQRLPPADGQGRPLACGCSAAAARVNGAAARSGRRAHRHPCRSMFIDAELCLPGTGGVPDFRLSRRLHFGPHAQKIGTIRRAPAYHSLESRLWTSTADHCAT